MPIPRVPVARPSTLFQASFAGVDRQGRSTELGVHREGYAHAACKDNASLLSARVRAASPACCAKKCLQRVVNLGDGAPLDALSKGWAEMHKPARKAALAALILNQKSVWSRYGSIASTKHIKYRVSPYGKVCQTAFLAIFGISQMSVWKRMAESRENHWLPVVVLHGNAGDVAVNARSDESVRLCVSFLQLVGSRDGQLRPTVRLEDSGHAEFAATMIYLPPSHSKTALHDAYVDWMTRVVSDFREDVSQYPVDVCKPLSMFLFRKVLKLYAGNFRFKGSDIMVCDVCTQATDLLRGQLSDAARQSVNVQWAEHLEDAVAGKRAYSDDKTRHGEEIKAIFAGGETASAVTKAVVAMDYAGGLGLPSRALEPASYSFNARRVVRMFGVRLAAGTETVQTAYIYNEDDGPANANTTCSCILRFVEEVLLPHSVRCLTLQADNCAGQNKNNTMIQFCRFLVDSSLLSKVTLRFMLVGHTHDDVDGGFGQLSAVFRRNDVFVLDNDVQSVEALVNGVHHHRAIVMKEFYDVGLVTSSIYRDLPGLASGCEFNFDARSPGTVSFLVGRRDSPFVRTYDIRRSRYQPNGSDAPQFTSVVSSMREMIRASVIKPPGLSDEKKQAMYETFYSSVPQHLRDRVCPRPMSTTEVESTIASSDASDALRLERWNAAATSAKRVPPEVRDGESCSKRVATRKPYWKLNRCPLRLDGCQKVRVARSSQKWLACAACEQWMCEVCVAGRDGTEVGLSGALCNKCVEANRESAGTGAS